MDRPTVCLVPYDRAYLGRSAVWLRDPEIKALTMAPDFTDAQQNAFFEGLDGRSDYKIWGVEADGEPIGAAGIKHIDGSCGEFWCYIGERDWWGRGVGRDILDRTEDKAREIGLSELTMVAGADNQRSIGAYEKSGFMREPGPGGRDVVWLRKVLGA